MKKHSIVFLKLAYIIFFAPFLFSTLLSNDKLLETSINYESSAPDEQFGWASAHNQEYCIITAPRDNSKGRSAGSAYIFKRYKMFWLFDTKLTEPTSSPFNYFGQDVDLEGNTLVISSLQNSKNGYSAGSIYIYEIINGEWKLKQEIIPQGDATFYSFGYSIDLNKDLLVVGAPGANNGNGKAFIYQFNGSKWELQKEITPKGNHIYHFGERVAISSNNVAISTKKNEVDTSKFCVVNLYSKGSNWELLESLKQPYKDKYNSFGHSIAVNDEFLVVSDPHASSNDNLHRFSGALIIYKFSNDKIALDTIIYGDNPSSHELFGFSLALNGKTIAISAPGNDSISENSGIINIFEYTGQWNRIHNIKTINAKYEINKFIGTNLSIDEYSLISSSPISQFTSNFANKAYFYELKRPISPSPNKIEVLVSPNPTEAMITVKIYLAYESKNLKIELYDLKGNKVSDLLFEEKVISRIVEKKLNLESISIGMYFLKVITDDFEIAEKIMIMR